MAVDIVARSEDTKWVLVDHHLAWERDKECLSDTRLSNAYRIYRKSFCGAEPTFFIGLRQKLVGLCLIMILNIFYFIMQ